MARLALSLTVLFFLFAFSTARFTSDHPENEVIDLDLSNSLPESDNKNTILLPSEKQISEPTGDVEIETEAAEMQLAESKTDLPESETEVGDPVQLTRPLTAVTFRPVNRHFQPKRPFSFQFSRRGCGGHRFKPVNPRFHGREVSYGNDMILAGENSDFDAAMFHGGVRGHHHHHHHDQDDMPRLPFKHHHHMFDRENSERPFHHHEEEREDEDREDREEGGLMMRFRKFMNHF